MFRSAAPSGSPNGFASAISTSPFGRNVKVMVLAGSEPKNCFTREHGHSCVCVCPAEGFGANARPPPTAPSGGDATADRPTLDAGVQSQRERYTATLTSRRTPKEVGPHASHDLGDPRQVADSLASVAPEPGQATRQMILRVTREGSPCHAEVAVP